MIVLSNGEYFDIGGSAFCLETGVSVVRVNVRFVEKVRSNTVWTPQAINGYDYYYHD